MVGKQYPQNAGYGPSLKEQIELEILIDDINHSHIALRLYEDDDPKIIPKRGIVIQDFQDGYATISLCESIAIAYDLV